MAVNRNKYHIQLKRTRVPANHSSNTIQNYGIVFGEPFYLQNENRLVMGKYVENGGKSTIPSNAAVKLVSQSLQDPDDSSKYVTVVEQGVHYKNRNEDSIVNLTDNIAEKIYPITKMSAVISDGEFELSEYLLHKVNIDKSTLVPYPSLGIDSDGVFVDDFDPAESSEGIPQSLVDIANSKVSIDDESSAVTQDISLGRDLYGVYVRIPGETAEELDYIKSYIDMILGDTLNNRLLAMEGNIYYLQKMINNIGSVYVGPTPPIDTNRLWIDTTVLTGGLKYCSNKTTVVWSHVPVAYT